VRKVFESEFEFVHKRARSKSVQEHVNRRERFASVKKKRSAPRPPRRLEGLREAGFQKFAQFCGRLELRDRLQLL
jgi:hypothetical protein